MNGDDDQIVTPVTLASSTPLVPAELSPITASERFLSASGMALVLASISSFITLIFIEFRSKNYLPDKARWLDLFPRSLQQSCFSSSGLSVLCWDCGF
jgi:hypothetical protein